MTISKIIPTYNEADTICQLVDYLKTHTHNSTEIIVVDGGSDDNTLVKAQAASATCFVCNHKGRAAQMNLGANQAKGDILYFVHADSFPPTSFATDIIKAVHNGHKAGCYRFRFNSDHPLLKINAYMTRFDRIMCRGGDQTLFITQELFDHLEGYRDDYIIMEDYDLIERIQGSASFKIIPKDVIVSARKYKHNNYLKVQIANFVVFMMYFSGCSQDRMCNTYKQMLSHPKL